MVDATGLGPVPSMRPAASGLTRPRLLRSLDRILDTRLGIVAAPAGSGKTTLMAQWTRTAGMPVAWHRAEPADSAADAPVGRLRAVPAPAIGWATQEAEHRTLETLAVALAQAPTPVLLVVDD